jgi:ribose transport system permease protein
MGETMTRLLGVFIIVVALWGILMASSEGARTAYTHTVMAKRLGFYGVLTIAAGVLIISGGIDLSMGSLVGLAAVCFGVLVSENILPVVPAILVVIAGSAMIGMAHGLLVTQLKLQPFLVTLCGMFMYRGLAQLVAGETSIALPGRPDVEQVRSLLVSGRDLFVPNQLVLLLLLGGALAVLLHGSVYGRYLYAIGFNEKAAAYAGIATSRYKILAYVICSTLTGLAGVLFILESSAQPTSAGTLLELYAITGAVLGGCTLRGGEGTVCGMLLGAAVLPLLKQICNFYPEIGSKLEYTVIGAALLLGTIVNELRLPLRSWFAAKKGSDAAPAKATSTELGGG